MNRDYDVLVKENIIKTIKEKRKPLKDKYNDFNIEEKIKSLN